MPTPRTFTPEQVIESRRRIGAREISLTRLAAEFGVNRTALTEMVYGRTYADIPGALVEKVKPLLDSGRRLTPEVVLFLRLNAANGVPTRVLAEAHGIGRNAAEFIIGGRYYADVPGAIDISKRRRKLTPEQAEQARRMYWTRQIPMKVLAQEYGIQRGPMGQLLRGRAYKDVPKAVPERIKATTRGRF